MALDYELPTVLVFDREAARAGATIAERAGILYGPGLRRYYEELDCEKEENSG